MREGVEDGAFEHGGAHLREERGHGWRGDEVGLGGVEVLPPCGEGAVGLEGGGGGGGDGAAEVGEVFVV